jgi:hypothetical protein
MIILLVGKRVITDTQEKVILSSTRCPSFSVGATCQTQQRHSSIACGYASLDIQILLEQLNALPFYPWTHISYTYMFE